MHHGRPLLALYGTKVFYRVHANSSQPRHSDHGRMPCGGKERSFWVGSKEAGVQSFLVPSFGIIAMCFMNVLNDMYKQCFKFIGEAIKHHFTCSNVTLSIVTNKDVRKFGIDGNISFEIFKFLDSQRFHIILHHILSSRCNITSQKRWYSMHFCPTIFVGTPESFKLGKTHLFTRILIHMWPCGQKDKIPNSTFIPFLWALRSQVQFSIKRQYARIYDLFPEPFVNPSWIRTTTTRQRIIDITQYFAPRRLFHPKFRLACSHLYMCLLYCCFLSNVC
mmetsp:Transcript_25431/g.37163  ORF Transcript_25431/g.37163 Transcript_25431/m.37163 type:complete len:277 (-) Transcript_25431:120-950(-)